MTGFIQRAPTRANLPHADLTIGQKTKTQQAQPGKGPSVNAKPTWVSSQGPRWKVAHTKTPGSPAPLAAQKQILQAKTAANTAASTSPTPPTTKPLPARSAVPQPAKKSEFQGIKGLLNKIGDGVHNAQTHKALAKAGYKQNEILSVGTVKQHNLQGELKALSSGQLNTAYTAHFKQPDGSTKELVVKFEAKYASKKDMPVFLKSLDIDPKESRETARNLAAKTLDNLLGWNNIVHTEIGVLKDPSSGQYKVVTAMEKAEGTSGYGELMGHKPISDEQFQRYQRIKKLADADPHNTMGNQDMLANVLAEFNVFSKSDLKEIKDPSGKVVGLETPHRSHNISPQDPKLKEELIKLQLQDTIMSQGDRHIGNYFIKTEPGGPDGKERVVGIKGIDNDQLGGTATTIEAYSTLKDLPPEIPSQVCQDIINLNPQDFQRQMECCLPKAEAEAATARLKLVKEHAQKVLDNNIKNGEGSLLPGSKYDYDNSYYMNFLAAHFPKEGE